MFIENFLIVLNNSGNLNELNEVKSKINDEILRTRSNDTGGQNGIFILFSLNFKMSDSCGFFFAMYKKILIKKIYSLS
jgi:hypothetical protein